MVKDGIETIYSPKLELLDPDALDTYLSGIPRVAVHKAPAETIKAPSHSIPERLARVGEAVRMIEVLRRQIGYHAAVLDAVLTQSPETVESLPESQQHAIFELASRLETEI